MNTTMFVFILYFILVIGLTFYGSRQISLSAKQANFSSEYFVGGRRLGPIALAILVAAGICSTGTFLGGPSLAGLYGPGYIMLFGLGQIPMTLFILGVLGKKINIIGRRTNAETYIDVFRYRFENYKPLIFVLVITILTFLVAAAVAEFTGGSRVIQLMSGIPFEYSLIAFGVIITLYTALGGLRGVSIVAILQGLIMTIASIFLIVGYLSYYKGFGPIVEGLAEIDMRLLTPNFGGEFPLIELLGFWFTYGIGVLGLPWAVQSTLGYDSTKTMKQAIFIGTVFVAFWSIFVGWAGVAGRVFAPNLEVPDFNVPNLAQGILSEPVAGIILAGIAGAGQSTIGALFILACGSIVVNVYKAFIKPDVSEQRVRFLTFVITAGIGLLTVILSLNPPPTLQIFISFSAGGCAAALISPLVLGLFWPRTNKYGAFAGVLGGLVSYILFSQIYLGIPVLYQAPLIFAFLLSFTLTIVVSLITEKPSKETIEIYFGSEKSA